MPVASGTVHDGLPKASVGGSAVTWVHCSRAGGPPAGLPSFLPSSLLCLCLLPASGGSRPGACAGQVEGWEVGGWNKRRAGTSQWTQRPGQQVLAVHAARAPWWGGLSCAPACRGRPPRHRWVPGVPGGPEGSRTWSQRGCPGISWPRPRHRM